MHIIQISKELIYHLLYVEQDNIHRFSQLRQIHCYHYLQDQKQKLRYRYII